MNKFNIKLYKIDIFVFLQMLQVSIPKILYYIQQLLVVLLLLGSLLAYAFSIVWDADVRNHLHVIEKTQMTSIIQDFPIYMLQ